MNRFYSKYRDKLKNQKPADFNEEDWKKLEAKLDAPSQSKNKHWPLFWPLFFIIPLLAAWSFYNLNGLDPLKHSSFNIPVSSSKSETKTVTIHDTIYIKEQIDVPRIVYLKKIIQNPRETKNPILSSDSPNSELISDQVNYASNFDSPRKSIENNLENSATPSQAFKTEEANKIEDLLNGISYEFEMLCRANGELINKKAEKED